MIMAPLKQNGLYTTSNAALNFCGSAGYGKGTELKKASEILVPHCLEASEGHTSN